MREGTTLNDRYELREEIGRGGQGVVWRAWDPRLGRDVAAKRVALTGVRTADAESANARLLREAKVMARVVHNNVVQVFDSVEHDGEPWLVLEYVPSRNLGEVLAEKGRLEPAEAARIGARIADGLAAAHEVGVEHRDVKPGNVLLTDKGQVKLTDFGIARAVGDSTLTRTGALSATLPYLAVEVARGMGWSTAADVWALGATLHTAVEGAPPFGFDDDDIRLLHRIMSGDFAVPRNAGPLTDVLMRLLATDPASRPDAETAVRMLDDVHAARSGPVTAAPSPWPAAPPAGPGTPTRDPVAGDVPSDPRGYPRPDVTSGPRGGPSFPAYPPYQATPYQGAGHPGAGYPGTPQPGTPYGGGTSSGVPYPASPSGPSAPGRRWKIVAAAAAVLVVLGAVGVGVAVNSGSDDDTGDRTSIGSGSSAPPLPATVGALSLPDDRQRDADPCALLDAPPLERFGRTEQLPGDTLDSCQIRIAESQSTTDQVSVAYGVKLAAGADPAGAQEKLGELTIVREAPSDASCRRTLILSDRTPVYVTVRQYSDRPAAPCGIADVATSSAANALARSGVVYVPGRLGNYLLATADACTVLDPATLTTVAKVDGDRRTAGFGRWSCTFGAPARDRPLVTVVFGAVGDPTGGAFGQRIPVSGREAYVREIAGTYNAIGCEATVVARSYAGTTGVNGAEVATIRVEGPDRQDQLCAQVTSLVSAAGPRLPTA